MKAIDYENNLNLRIPCGLPQGQYRETVIDIQERYENLF